MDAAWLLTMRPKSCNVLSPWQAVSVTLPRRGECLSTHPCDFDAHLIPCMFSHAICRALSALLNLAGIQVEDLLRETLILRATLEQETTSSILERLLPKRFKQYQKGISSRA